MRTKDFFDENGKYVKDKNNIVRTDCCRPATNVFGYLGDMDAWGEWNRNKKLAQHMFLHTQAYCDFLKDSSLILLGRTGVGKTAILLKAKEHMLEEEKNLVVLNIDSTDLLVNLSNCIELTTLNQTTVSIETKKIIRMFIETAIMQELACKDEDDEDIEIIKKYLEGSGFIERSGWKKFISVFLDEANNVNIENEGFKVTKSVATSMYRITNNLSNKGYDAAKEALSAYLSKKGRAVVLIDSLDQYNVNNKELVLIVKGLIQACFYYYNNPDHNILLKIALPSEIYNKVLVRLPDKQRCNTVVINWKYKELVIFLALRIYANYKAGVLQKFTFCEQYEKYDAFYADVTPKAYDNSVQLLSNILPEVCTTSLSFPFLTLPYCLRHTLKKPREVLNMFNVIIDTLVKNEDMEYFIKYPEEIKNVIHKTQEQMISSALSMYASTYVSIYAACQSLLHEKYFLFKGKDINADIKKAVIDAKKAEEELKSTSDYIDSSVHSYLDESELKRILIESGLVGKVSKSSRIKSNHPKIHNKEEICVLSADFDFNVSATSVNFVFVDNAQYVFHPMCYENYWLYLDKNTLVYPAGDDSDVLIETIVSQVQ